MATNPIDPMAELRGRISELELAMRELRRRFDEVFGAAKPWWQKAAGSMPNDEVYEQFIEILRKNREASYAAATAEADRLEEQGGRNQRAKKKSKRAG